MITKRSQQKELLDLGPDFYTPEEYQDALRKLFQINKLLGFFGSTKKLLKLTSKNASLIDVGCGGGLFLIHLNQLFPQMQMLGIDNNPEAIAQAQKEQKTCKSPDNLSRTLSFKVQDVETAIAEHSFDILLATLVCHHLTDDELISFLAKAYENVTQMIILNDLHRHPLAYKSFAWLSPHFFHNRLITHDGLISIQRGFIRAEWENLLKKAQIPHYQINWGWPFRWQIILQKK